MESAGGGGSNNSNKRLMLERENEEEEEEGKRMRGDRNRVTFQSTGGALVWGAKDIILLREKRVNADLIGIDPVKASQHDEHDAPLALSPEEVELACGVLGVDVPESHRINTLKKRVVCELWSRGFWIGRGANFGADYLVYEGNPQVYHAALLVVVQEWNNAMSLKALSAMARLATTVKKQGVIATENPQGKIVFIRFKWKGV